MEHNKYNKLSMSIMLDNREKTDNEMLIPKISPAIWIPSKKITTCYECKEIFGWLNRKHHCRYCGYIFCLGFDEFLPSNTITHLVGLNLLIVNRIDFKKPTNPPT